MLSWAGVIGNCVQLNISMLENFVLQNIELATHELVSAKENLIEKRLGH